jgi:hypothetical protein
LLPPRFARIAGMTRPPVGGGRTREEEEMYRHRCLPTGALRHRRRGATLVLVAVSSVVLLGAAALTIDVGKLYTTRIELQRAADSASMAGVSAYLSDAAWRSESNSNSWSLTPELGALIDARAQDYSSRNHTLGSVTLLEGADIVKGYYDFDNPSAALDTSGGHRFNAVEVTVRRTAGSANGPVPYHFARILGQSEGDVVARATAALDDHFAAYTPPGPVIIPFTISRDVYDGMLVTGPDEFSYDELEDAVHATSDGVREVRLFPWSNNSSDAGSGTFGVLNIGTPNQGLPGVIDQITNGVQPSDLEAEVGAPTLMFIDASGDPVTYQMTGGTGLGSGMDSALLTRVGDIVAFFLHDGFVQDGSNTIFTIVDLRFGRVMHVDLSGALDNRRIVIQPVNYTGGGVQTDPDAPPTNGQVAVITLVR